MTYVIIGAMDGVSYDNIFDVLTEDDTALFVEPIEIHFEKLKENVKKLSCQVILDSSIISNKSEDVVMAYVPINALSMHEDFYRGCSSVVKFGKPLNRYLSKINENFLKYHQDKAITFDELLVRHGLDQVDIVQVDCEGYDQVIVDSIDIERYKIKRLKFETHYITNEFIDYMIEKTNPESVYHLEADIIFCYEYTI